MVLLCQGLTYNYKYFTLPPLPLPIHLHHHNHLYIQPSPSTCPPPKVQGLLSTLCTQPPSILCFQELSYKEDIPGWNFQSYATIGYLEYTRRQSRTRELCQDYDDQNIGVRCRNKSRVTSALQVAYRKRATLTQDRCLRTLIYDIRPVAQAM